MAVALAAPARRWSARPTTRRSSGARAAVLVGSRSSSASSIQHARPPRTTARRGGRSRPRVRARGDELRRRGHRQHSTAGAGRVREPGAAARCSATAGRRSAAPTSTRSSTTPTPTAAPTRTRSARSTRRWSTGISQRGRATSSSGAATEARSRSPTQLRSQLRPTTTGGRPARRGRCVTFTDISERRRVEQIKDELRLGRRPRAAHPADLDPRLARADRRRRRRARSRPRPSG